MKKYALIILIILFLALVGCGKTYTVTFYDYYGNVIETQTVKEGKSAKLPDYKDSEGLIYVGIDGEDYKNVRSDIEVHPIYRIDADYIVLEEIYNELKEIYSERIIDSNVHLLKGLGDIEIEWSSDSIYLSSDGKYMRPKEDMVVALKANLTYNNKTVIKEVNFNLKGYKKLENIASGYVYRGYDQLTDEFFETMDIIYCAFLTFNSDGSFKANTTVLENIQKYVLTKAHKKGIYVVASLGGGGEEPRKAFVEVCKKSETRKAFIDNVIYIVNRFGFDGVDIDWETPTSSEAPYFTLLVQELNEKLKENNPSHLLTAAITGGKWQPPRYDLVNSGKYLDYVNVMTYGMCYSNGNYHNALYESRTYNDLENGVGNTLESCSIEESIVVFNNLSVSNDKLIFGAAFYGVRQKKTDGVWSSNGSVSYTSIKELMDSDNYIYIYDSNAGVPYLINKDKNIFISFDDTRSILEKCEYLKETGCAGIMYWENGLDTTGDLVNAINEGLKK